jgi:CO/xanthine dehydrogenase Mo-binding subunit
LGKSVPRIDGVAKVIGGLQYGTDFHLEGMLHGKILFSDRPYARILSIDATKALALPGVKGIVTGADAPDARYGVYLFDRQILAKEVVRYVGEPVAAVAATTEKIAEAALALIDVEYEDLEPLLDPEDSLAPDAPILHPDLDDYVGSYPYIRYGNVCMEAVLERGDIESGFAEADVVVEREFATGAVNHGAIEPHVCVAGYDRSGKLTIWTSTQQLKVTHQTVAQALDMPMNRVKVVPMGLGGGFGGKLKANLEPVTALLADKIGRPVRMLLSRREEFIAARNRAPFRFKVKLGAKSDGTLVAGDIDIITDSGGYSDHTVGTATHAVSSAMGSYNVPNYHARGRAVYTNNPDHGCMRGYGNLQMAFALEATVDLIAAELGIDPSEVRARNLLEEGDVLLTTQQAHGVQARPSLDQALEASGYRDKKGRMGPYRGIGIACITKPSGLLSSSAIVNLNEDGSISITSAVVDIGTGTQTVLCQIAAEVLGVEMDAVAMASQDSDSAPYDLGSIASRTIFDGGNAVRVACEDLRDQIIDRASVVLGADPADLVLRDGSVVHADDPEKLLPLGAVAAISIYVTGGPPIGTCSWLGASVFDEPVGHGFSEGPFPSFAFATHVAEVEVDPDTGKVTVIHYTASHDIGKALNPAGLEGQVKGGIVQGLGGALFEEMLISEGRVQNTNFADYRMPTPVDAPEITVAYIEEPEPNGPFGAKGIGEQPAMGPAAAVANAIFDATGVMPDRIPITPERLYYAMKDAAG